jgi:hypothetical protein
VLRDVTEIVSSLVVGSNVVELSEADVVAVVDHPPRPTDKSVA